MARSGFPSMTALLGMLAVAGYKNRDSLSQMMGNRAGGTGMGGGTVGGLAGALGGLLGRGQAAGQSGDQAGKSGFGGILSGLASGAGLGGLLGGGLSEMSTRFHENGHGDAVDSWVSTGPNRAVTPTTFSKPSDLTSSTT